MFKLWVYLICISSGWFHLVIAIEEEKPINVQAVLLGSESGGGTGSGGANSVNYGNPTPTSTSNLIIQNQGKLIILLASDLMKQTNCTESDKMEEMLWNETKSKRTRDVVPVQPKLAEAGSAEQSVDSQMQNFAQSFFYNAKVPRQHVSEGPNRPNKPDRPDKPDSSEKPDRPDRPSKPDSSAESVRPDKPDRPERPDNPKTPGSHGLPQTFIHLPQGQNMPVMPNQPIMPSQSDTIPNMPEMPLFAENLHYRKERKRALQYKAAPPDEYDDDNDEKDDESDHNDSEENKDENDDETVKDSSKKLHQYENFVRSTSPDEYNDDNDERDKGNDEMRQILYPHDQKKQKELLSSAPPDEYDDDNDERDEVYDESVAEQVDETIRKGSKNHTKQTMSSFTKQNYKTPEFVHLTPPDEYDDDNDERDEPDAHNDSEENHDERNLLSAENEKKATDNDDEHVIKIFDDHADEYEEEEETLLNTSEPAVKRAASYPATPAVAYNMNIDENDEMEDPKEFYLEKLLRNLKEEADERRQYSKANKINENTDNHIDALALVQNLLELYSNDPRSKQELYELVNNEYNMPKEDYKPNSERLGYKNQYIPEQSQPQQSKSGYNLVNGPVDSPVYIDEGNVYGSQIEFVPIAEEISGRRTNIDRRDRKHFDFEGKREEHENGNKNNNIEVRQSFGGQYFRYDFNDHDDGRENRNFIPRNKEQSADYDYDADRGAKDRSYVDQDMFDRDFTDHDDIDHDNIDHDDIDRDDIDHDNEDNDEKDYDHHDLDYKDYDHLEGDYRGHDYRESEWRARERLTKERDLTELGRRNRDQEGNFNRAFNARYRERDVHGKKDFVESDRTQRDHERRDHERRDHNQRDHKKRDHKKADTEETLLQNRENWYHESEAEVSDSAKVNRDQDKTHVEKVDHVQRAADHDTAPYKRNEHENGHQNKKSFEKTFTENNAEAQNFDTDYDYDIMDPQTSNGNGNYKDSKIGPEQVYSQEIEDLYQDYQSKTHHNDENKKTDSNVKNQSSFRENNTISMNHIHEPNKLTTAYQLANQSREQERFDVQFETLREFDQKAHEKVATQTKSMEIAKSKGNMRKILNTGNTKTNAERESNINESDSMLANGERNSRQENQTQTRNERLRKLREEHERKKAERAAKKQKRNERKSKVEAKENLS